MKQYAANFKKFLPLLHDLISRDIKVKYRRSVLGLLWSVLNPLLMMLVITFVFSNIFKFDIPYFPIYYLTGSVIFNFYSEATSGAMSSVLNSASLIKKVYIPKYLFSLEKVLFGFINLLFSLIAVVIVMLVTKTPIHATIWLFPLPLLYALIFSIGAGLMLSVFAVFFRDTIHLYGVFLTALSFLTPVFYPISIIPESMRWVFKMNPLVHFVDYFRQCVLYGEIPSIKSNIYCLIFAFGALIIGAIIFRKCQDKFVLYV